MVAALLNAKLVYVYIKLTMHYTNIILMKCIFRRNIKIKRLLVATCCGLNQVSIDDFQIQICVETLYFACMFLLTRMANNNKNFHDSYIVDNFSISIVERSSILISCRPVTLAFCLLSAPISQSEVDTRDRWEFRLLGGS